MNKLLTIIIPTWNRVQELNESLRRLLPQVNAYFNKVGVYVSDNASEDETENVVNKYKKEFSSIVSYKRQETNIGAEGNFRDAILNIESEYFILLGDDDIAMPSYIDNVMMLLESNLSASWICYNALTYNDRDMYRGVRDPFCKKANITKYRTGGDFICEHLIYPSLISQNIYNRKLYIQTLETINIAEYHGYGWFSVMCHGAIDKEVVYYDVPLLVNRSPSVSPWTPKAPLYHIEELGKLFSSLNKYHDGIFLSWLQFQKNERDVRMLLLDLIAANRSNYSAEMVKGWRKFSCTKLYAKQLYLYAKYPKWLAVKIDKILRGYAMINKSYKTIVNDKETNHIIFMQ